VDHVWPQLMRNPIRGYDWGSTTVLAALQGRRPSGQPEAELWLGAHPSDPSFLVDHRGVARPLDALVAEEPQTVLGERVRRRFDDRLPYLLKVLAIDHPLSLQVHPTAERARAAFTGEVQALGGHEYVDAWPKPELVYALQPLDALCGFRHVDETERLLAVMAEGSDDDDPVFAALRTAIKQCEAGTHPMVDVLRVLVTWPSDQRARLVRHVAAACTTVLADRATLAPADAAAIDWARRLCGYFPADPLVTAPFLLDLVRLEVGEVLYVPAGAPHAYLHGVGVEIMANSDNVVRAGLTHKAVAVEELLHIVDGDSRPVRDVPTVALGEHETAWVSPAEQFQLGRVDVPAGTSTTLARVDSPQVLLCLSGLVDVVVSGQTVAAEQGAVRLSPGQSAFVGPAPEDDSRAVTVTALDAAQLFTAVAPTRE
jgi:mannose-6-phosphate isomerase